MDIIVYLIPGAIFLGLLGLGAFFWCLNSDQYEDMDGAAARILIDDEDSAPKPRAEGERPLGD